MNNRETSLSCPLASPESLFWAAYGIFPNRCWLKVIRTRFAHPLHQPVHLFFFDEEQKAVDKDHPHCRVVKQVAEKNASAVTSAPAAFFSSL
ncbi:hypothetical protein [Desulfobulbus propionicus]|jgi:hypothetical protein